jgi:hypothetical protein
VIVESVLYLPVEAVHPKELLCIGSIEGQVGNKKNLLSGFLIGAEISSLSCDLRYLLDARDLEARSARINSYNLTQFKTTVPFIGRMCGVHTLRVSLNGAIKVTLNLLG